MSYTPPPPPGGFNAPVQYAGQNPRPATVTVASILLYLTAALLILTAAVSIFSISSISEADLLDAIKTDPTMTDELAETTATITLASIWVVAVVYLLIALVFVLCGIFVSRGKQWARVTSWVFGGIAALCCGAGGLLSLAAGGMAGGGNASQEELQEALTGDLPAWIGAVNIIVPILLLLAGLAIVIMLALPPSNAFFRKPEPVWTPPTYPSV